MIPVIPASRTSTVPAWLAAAAARITALSAAEFTDVPPPMDGSGRRCAILVVFSPQTRSQSRSQDSGSCAGPADSAILLTERSATLRTHAGQVSFPGGAIDAADGGPVDAALREAREETGLEPERVEVVATLPEVYVAHSANVVVPVLAWSPRPSPVGVVDRAEVASVGWVPVRHLLDPANRLLYPPGSRPAFRVAYAEPALEAATHTGQGLLVWGFTGRLLDRLFALAGWEALQNLRGGPT